jgi:hypothetical protein
MITTCFSLILIVLLALSVYFAKIVSQVFSLSIWFSFIIFITILWANRGLIIDTNEYKTQKLLFQLKTQFIYYFCNAFMN